MAIQMRRGFLKDFDPEKMLPGEWGVSIDTDTRKQQLYMCFAPGIVKRMGTYEDFAAQIAEATGEIKEQYLQAFAGILRQIEADKTEAAEEYAFVEAFKKLLDESYVPEVETAIASTAEAADRAEAAIHTVTEAADRAETAKNETAAVAEGVKNAVANIEIGGRNILTGTRDFTADCTMNTASSITEDKYNGLSVLCTQVPDTSYRDACLWQSITVQPDTFYTLSFYGKAEIDGVQITSYLHPNAVVSGYNKQGNITHSADGSIKTTLTSNWERYWTTWKTRADITEAKTLTPARIIKNSNMAYVGKKIYICGLKLEAGNKITDWTSAPEDVDTKIDAAKGINQDLYRVKKFYYLAGNGVPGSQFKISNSGLTATDGWSAVIDLSIQVSAAVVSSGRVYIYSHGGSPDAIQIVSTSANNLANDISYLPSATDVTIEGKNANITFLAVSATAMSHKGDFEFTIL